MAPLYQHYNKQRVDLTYLTVGNYTAYTNNVNNVLVQDGNTLRAYYAGTTNPSQYANNAYWRRSITDGPKTVIAKMSWNTVNHGGWIGISFGSSTGYNSAPIWHISSPGHGFRQLQFGPLSWGYNGSWYDTVTPLSAGTYFWLKVVDDGSRFSYYYSLDGSSYTGLGPGLGKSAVNDSLSDVLIISMVPGYANGVGTDATIHSISVTY